MISEFSILDYCFYLDVLDLKKYFDENVIEYRCEKNIIVDGLSIFN